MQKKEQRILVVDDTPVFRTIFTALLQAQGYRMLQAEAGDSGLALIEQEVPDLVVSDGEMPGLNGLELTLAVRANPHTAHIPIIILSAIPEEMGIELARQCGANAFLHKTKSAQLVPLVRRLLDETEAKEGEEEGA